MTGKPEGVLYRDATTRILDVAGLAKSFADSFNMTPQTFTSAEFALQMIAGVDQVSFTLSSSTPDDASGLTMAICAPSSPTAENPSRS